MTNSPDPFLESFASLYQENTAIRSSLLVALMRCMCAKAKSHKNPDFPAIAMNFFISLEATSRKSFDFISANFLGPSLRSIQRVNALRRGESFIICEEDNIRDHLMSTISKMSADPSNITTISASYDGTKTPTSLALSTSHKAIVGGAYPDHFISIENMSEAEVKDKLDRNQS